MYISIAGGVYKEGRRGWKWQARRRGIKKPWVIHYFHIGYITSKLGAMVNNNMWFVTPDKKCVNEQTKMCKEWPIWQKPIDMKSVILVVGCSTVVVFCVVFMILVRM